MTIEKESGVYTILNLVNKKIYVGSSYNVNNRLRYHLWALRNNRHHNKHLQSSFNTHGESSFEFSILESWPAEYLYSMENYWISMFNSFNSEFGYNIAYVNPDTKTLLPVCRYSLLGKKRPEHSARMSGDRHPFYGKKRQDTSEMNKLRVGDKNPNYGKSNPRIAEFNKSRAISGTTNSIRIVDLYSGRVFVSINSAASELGMSKSTLKAMISGRLKNKTSLVKLQDS